MAGSGMVQSLCRALDIVEALTHSDHGLGLGEISERVGLKRTTAHNLLRTLRSRGYVGKDLGGGYCLGPAFEEIFQSRFSRGVLARGEMALKGLSRLFPGGTVTLSELVGSEIVCRLRISPDAPGVARRPVAMTLGAFGSATGLCFQAFNDTFRAALGAEGMFEEAGQPFPGSREDFRKAVSEARRTGVAAVTGGGAWRFAAPVCGNFAIGLSLDAVMTDTLKRRICSELMAAARKIADGHGAA